MKRLTRVIGVTLMLLLLASVAASAEPWRFGVMSDTQWIGTEDGKNPYTVSVDIINQLNQRFITHKVKFVIQVGDLTDKGNKAPYTLTKVVDGVTTTYPGTATQALYTRALFAQPLYNAGIGFFPLRGNHEDLLGTAEDFVHAFPQTQGGQQNMTPSDVFTIPNPDSATQPFPVKTNPFPFYVGAHVGSPPISGLAGLSYAFDFDNVRFVLLDQFTRTDNTGAGNANNNVLDQLPWVEAMLASKPVHGHGFVFSHKNLIGEQHTDTLFGANPAANIQGQQAFFSSLANHGVRYAFGGHDHVHQRSLISSPNATPSVQEIICASDSSKFYIPLGNDLYKQTLPNPTVTVNNDLNYNTATYGVFNGPRETSVSQELYKAGYYIVTVDGPRVIVDYYSADNTGASFDPNAGEFLISTTPHLTFTKKETFGYSVNGKEFLVPQGAAYTDVQDSFDGTDARILAGTNQSKAQDGSYRPLTKAVNTGWTHKGQHRWNRGGDRELASQILSLWGLADLGTDQTDTYVLSMTYDTLRGHMGDLRRGGFGVAVRDGDDQWINAVDANFGGTKRFVLGPWKPHYALGTYGVDLLTRTAWAVINHTGDFAVAEDLEWGRHSRDLDR